jgi:hypothetical protein
MWFTRGRESKEPEDRVWNGSKNIEPILEDQGIDLVSVVMIGKIEFARGV